MVAKYGVFKEELELKKPILAKVENTFSTSWNYFLHWYICVGLGLGKAKAGKAREEIKSEG